MTDFLLDLLSLSLGGSLAALVLLVLSRCSRLRYGGRWRCLAWLLLCLRLAVPGAIIPVEIDLLPAPIQVELPADRVIYEAPARQPAPVTGEMAPTAGESGAVPAPQEPGWTLSASQVIFAIWLAGGVSVLALSLVRHRRCLAWLDQRKRPAEDPAVIRRFNRLADGMKMEKRPDLGVCPALSSPMLVGLFHPALFLPGEDLGEKELEYGMLHELIHCRRRHIWLKALALWVCALHWFNPCAWLVARAVERDTELACDEEVLTCLPQDQHAAYGRAILAAAQQKGATYET